MAFEENTLLFGSDPTEHIVAIELGDTGTVRVYRREKDGSTITALERWASKADHERHIQGACVRELMGKFNGIPSGTPSITETESL